MRERDVSAAGIALVRIIPLSEVKDVDLLGDCER